MSLIILFILVEALSVNAALEQYPHVQIWDDLLRNYNRRVNPVRNPKTPINLTIQMLFDNTIALDFKNQVLSLRAWMSLSWRDEFLVFDPWKYNTEILYGEPGDIWLPELVLDPSLDDDSKLLEKSGIKALIFPNGSINWVPKVTINIRCHVKVEDFPFDTQTCSINIFPWSQSPKKLNISTNLIESKFFQHVPSGEWITEDPDCQIEQTEYIYQTFKCCLTLKRQSLFYVFNFILPCMTLVLVGSLTFFMPVDSGEKVSFSVTLLLAMTVMVKFVLDNVPSISTGVPFLGKLIMACIMLLALATTMSVIVVKVLSKGQADQGLLQLNCLCRKENLISDGKPNECDDSHKWRQIAICLDRLFLAIYLIVTGVLVTWIAVMANK